MSGGAFDYAHVDARDLAERVRAMIQYVEDLDDEAKPPELLPRLRDLESNLEENKERLRVVEWVASGDHGTEKLQEVLED